jgi:hypothetical protein
MKIFICWSRGRSEMLAKGLHALLLQVIDGVDPFLSSEIEPGRPWFGEISQALRDSQTGIVCLTPESRHAPWLHFEAGALANAVSRENGLLYTYLHAVKPYQLSGPLTAFQATLATHEDTRLLVRSLARQAAARRAFDEAQIADRFDQAWPKLEAVLQRLDEVTIETAIPGFAGLFNFKTFTEPMRECPDLGWIARLERLARVETRLIERRDEVLALERPHLVRLYDELQRQLDVYAMNVKSKLLAERPFDPAADGLLDIPNDVLQGCETPRVRAQELVRRLLDPSGSPVMEEEALRFDASESPEKKITIQRLERQLAAREEIVPSTQRIRALGSRWDLDRIACYLSLAEDATEASHVADLIEQVGRELDLAESRRLRSSLMPLYYAIRAMASVLERIGTPDDRLRRAALDVAVEVERYVTADPARDARGKFARRLARIRQVLTTGPATA